MAKIKEPLKEISFEKKVHNIQLGFGITFLLIFLLSFLFPFLFQAILKEKLKFSGTLFNKWIVNEEPWRFTVYCFNWTNPNDVFNKSIKPNFEEIGPYTYQLMVEKHNVVIHDNGSTTYTALKKITFLKDESRPLTDLITTVNPIPNFIAFKARFWNTLTKLGLSVAFRSFMVKLHTTKTVEELLFKGFHDPILDVLSKVPISDLAEFDKFGYLYKKNYTDDVLGPVNFHTEVDEDYGVLYTYKGRNRTDAFPDYCGKVKGYIGEFIGMNRNTKKGLVIFSPDVNSYVTTEYDKDIYVEGLTLAQYGVTNIYDNGTFLKKNKCFCNGDCIPSGVLNTTASLKNVPIFMSLPHFHKADVYYRNAIDGMKPNHEKHSIFAVYEKTLGILVKANIRMQINVLLQPIKGIGMYSKVPKYFIPVLHISQDVIMDPRLITDFIFVQLVPKIVQYSSIFCLCISLILISYSLFKKVHQNK